MIINRNRKNFFCLILPYNIFIKPLFNYMWCRHILHTEHRSLRTTLFFSFFPYIKIHKTFKILFYAFHKRKIFNSGKCKFSIIYRINSLLQTVMTELYSARHIYKLSGSVFRSVAHTAYNPVCIIILFFIAFI